MNTLVRGATSEIVVTRLRTVPIFLDARAGINTTPPPIEVSANIAASTDLLPERRRKGFPATWIAARVGCGVVQALVIPALPG